MVLNKTSKEVWAYQTAVGTPLITAVDSLSYEFGEYNNETGKWSIPTTQNPAEPHWVYNSGTPTLTNTERKFPTFKKVFVPVTAQVYAWMQGLPEDPLTADVVNISTLTEGMTSPLTIRNEELGGTHPDVTQAVDCYVIGLVSNAEMNKEFMVEAEFVYGELEDFDNSGVERPILTTPPLTAGLMTGSYYGNPILEWNAVPIPGVEKAIWMEKKAYTIVSSDEGVVQTIHTGKSESVKIILWGGIEVDDLWDHYKLRSVPVDMTIQMKKLDGVSNILFTFTNCRITSYERIGERYKGKYASIIKIEAEKVEESSDWFTEGGVTFATHWKANIA